MSNCLCAKLSDFKKQLCALFSLGFCSKNGRYVKYDDGWWDEHERHDDDGWYEHEYGHGDDVWRF